jgi:hypothetical protein
MKFSPENMHRKAVLAVAIAVGVSLGSPPLAEPQAAKRDRRMQQTNRAKDAQSRPRGNNRRANLQQNGARGQNRPPRGGAQRGQRPEPGGRARGQRPGGMRPNDRQGGGRFGDRDRPGRPGEPGRESDRPWQKVPEKRRLEVLKFVEEHFPRMWVEMNRLHENQPDRFRQRMRRIFPAILHMMEVNKRDPQMGSLMIRERQLDMRIRQTAMKFHKAPNAGEKRKLRREIHDLVGEVFDVQLRRRALEITSLESRLLELKGRLSGQKEMRDDLIQQRTQRLLKKKPPGMRDRKRPGKDDADGIGRVPPRDAP